MSEPFIPKEARPDVLDELGRRAWEVAFHLERLARGDAPDVPSEEAPDAAGTEHAAR